MSDRRGRQSGSRMASKGADRPIHVADTEVLTLMGAAKRRGSLEQRIEQSRQRSHVEAVARHEAQVELNKARQATTPAEAERFIQSAQSHRKVAALAALAALLGAMAIQGRRR